MGADNEWWLDVLENGPASRFADYFDIDWQSPASTYLRAGCCCRCSATITARCWRAGELKLAFDAEQGSFSVFYYEHRFPVDPREYPRMLGRGLERLQTRLGERASGVLELQIA